MSLTDIYLKIFSQIFVYHSEEGFLAKLHPSSKTVLLFVCIVLAILCTRVEVLLLTLATLIILASTSINLKRISSMFISLAMFIAPMAFFMIIYIAISCRSLYRLAETTLSITIAMSRLAVISIAFYIFFVTTKPQSIARVLNKLGIPYKYGYGFVISLRLLSILSNDLIEIMSIQKLRGLNIGNNFLNKIKNYLAVFIPLAISTLNRVDEITVSLEVKGFGLKDKRSYLYVEPFRFTDTIFSSLCIALAIATLYFCI